VSTKNYIQIYKIKYILKRKLPWILPLEREIAEKRETRAVAKSLVSEA
jgi:hypothetical protein